MAVQAGIRIGVDGEREYRQAIQNINQQTKELKSEMDLLTSSFDKNATAEQKAAAQAEIFRKEVDNQQKKVDTLADKYRKQTTELNRLAVELEDAKREYGENSEQAQRAQKAYDNYSTTVSKTKTELNRAETELNKMNTALEKAEKDAKGADGSLATVPSTLDQIRAGADKVSEALAGVASGLDTASQKTAAISAAAAAGLGASAVMASNYEDAIAKVSTIADESVVSIEDMGEAIRDLSNESGIAATDLAEAVYNAISAGQDTADAVGFVERATRLARSGFAETGDALDILTTIMNAYGLEAEKVGEVSDILIQTQNLGKTTVADLASAMGKVIPTAASFGVELDQLGAAYAVITANGVQTREATTYMNALFNELGKSSTGLAKILADKTGKSFAELTEDGLSVADVLAILKEAADEDGLAFNDIFSSSEAAKAGLILLGDSADDFNGTLDEMRKAAGSTDRAFDKLDTTSYGIQKTLNQLKNTGIDLGETLLEMAAPALDSLSNLVTSLREAVSGMDDRTKKMIVTAGLAVAALSPALKALSGLVSVASTAASAISAIFSNPALLAITAGAAAIGAVTVAIIANEEAHRRHTQAIAEAASQTSNYTSAERDMLTAMNDSISAMEASRAATAEATEAISFQRDRAVELIDELLSLADEQGNVSETDQAHAQVIIDELNRAYGLEIELIDGQIQGYDSLRDSVYEVIEAKTAEALIERHRDDYLTALEAQDDLLQSIRTSRYNAAEAEEEYNRNAQAAARATAYLQEHQYEMTRREYDAYLDYVEGLEAGAATAHENWMQSIEDEQTYSQAYLENSRLIQNYDAAQVAAQRGNTQEVIDLMTGRTNAWTDYGNTVSAETSAALNAMEDEVQRAGEYALELRTNWENGVDGYTEDMVEEAEQSYLDILAAYSGALDDAGLIGSDFVQGLINGLDSRQSDLAQKAKNIGSTVSHGVRDVLGIASPSKVAAQIGEYFGEGLVIGLDRSAVDVGDAAAAQADEMVAAFAGVNDVFGSAAVGQLLGGGAASNAVNYGGVSITVNANDEMTAQEIAEAVMEQMQSAVERKGAVYA